ncbi:hypothetical protein GCM10027402_24790 [Arthrobacter monumenti]
MTMVMVAPGLTDSGPSNLKPSTVMTTSSGESMPSLIGSSDGDGDSAAMDSLGDDCGSAAMLEEDVSGAVTSPAVSSPEEPHPATPTRAAVIMTARVLFLMFMIVHSSGIEGRV